jgi:hypothetical protein
MNSDWLFYAFLLAAIFFVAALFLPKPWGQKTLLLAFFVAFSGAIALIVNEMYTQWREGPIPTYTPATLRNSTRLPRFVLLQGAKPARDWVKIEYYKSMTRSSYLHEIFPVYEASEAAQIVQSAFQKTLNHSESENPRLDSAARAAHFDQYLVEALRNTPAHIVVDGRWESAQSCLQAIAEAKAGLALPPPDALRAFSDCSDAFYARCQGLVAQDSHLMNDLRAEGFDIHPQAVLLQADSKPMERWVLWLMLGIFLPLWWVCADGLFRR